eukprot:115465-Rhodomonas_salina.1
MEGVVQTAREGFSSFVKFEPGFTYPGRYLPGYPGCPLGIPTLLEILQLTSVEGFGEKGIGFHRIPGVGIPTPGTRVLIVILNKSGLVSFLRLRGHVTLP